MGFKLGGALRGLGGGLQGISQLLAENMARKEHQAALAEDKRRYEQDFGMRGQEFDLRKQLHGAQMTNEQLQQKQTQWTLDQLPKQEALTQLDVLIKNYGEDAFKQPEFAGLLSTVTGGVVPKGPDGAPSIPLSAQAAAAGHRQTLSDAAFNVKWNETRGARLLGAPQGASEAGPQAASGTPEPIDALGALDPNLFRMASSAGGRSQASPVAPPQAGPAAPRPTAPARMGGAGPAGGNDRLNDVLDIEMLGKRLGTTINPADVLGPHPDAEPLERVTHQREDGTIVEEFLPRRATRDRQFITPPPAAMQQKHDDASVGLDTLGRVGQLYNSAFVGPAAGRWRQFQGKLPEMGKLSQVPKGYFEFSSAVTNLKNQVIKAVTGAQMSEPEATRIIGQLPDFAQRSELFEANMKETENNLAYIKAITKARGGPLPASTGARGGPGAAAGQQIAPVQQPPSATGPRISMAEIQVIANANGVSPEEVAAQFVQKKYQIDR